MRKVEQRKAEVQRSKRYAIFAHSVQLDPRPPTRAPYHGTKAQHNHSYNSSSFLFPSLNPPYPSRLLPSHLHIPSFPLPIPPSTFRFSDPLALPFPLPPLFPFPFLAPAVTASATIEKPKRPQATTTAKAARRRRTTSPRNRILRRCSRARSIAWARARAERTGLGMDIGGVG